MLVSEDTLVARTKDTEQTVTDYRELVGKVSRADRFTLEDFSALSELPIVEQ